jgi:hypothetical protein
LGTTADNNADMRAKGRQVSIKGEDNVMSKLSAAKVKVIRDSSEVQRILAIRFGVARSLIGAIRQRKRWAHVE